MITVVMPCLNAAGALRRSLPPLVDGVLAGLVGSVVVADGGSTDQTLEIADAAGAEIISVQPGRGVQLAAGVEAAHGDFLLLLHADTVLGSDWVQAAGQFCQDVGPMGQKAAYFKFALDDTAPAARRLERMVALRNATLGLPYGDQGLLIPRSFLRTLGGVPPIPLMEDVALVRKIGKKSLVQLPCKATTSAERYKQNGYMRQSTRNLGTLARYYMGVSPEKLAARYYEAKEE